MEIVKNKVTEVWNSIVDIANSSITPHQISLAISIGVVGGLWPIPMTSFLGCILLQSFIGIFDRIDTRQMMLIQVINMVMTPFHLYYFPLFIRFGESLFKVKEDSKFDASTLVENLNKDFLGTISSSTVGLMHGVFGWMSIVPFALFLFYFFFLPAFKILLKEDPDEYGDTKKDK